MCRYLPLDLPFSALLLHQINQLRLKASEYIQFCILAQLINSKGHEDGIGNYIHNLIYLFHSLQDLQSLQQQLLILFFLVRRASLLILLFFLLLSFLCLLSGLFLAVQVSDCLKVIRQIHKTSQSVESLHTFFFDFCYFLASESVFYEVDNFIFLENLFQIVLSSGNMNSIVPKDQWKQRHSVHLSEMLDDQLSPLPPEILQLFFQQFGQVIHEFREEVNKSTEVVSVEIVAIKTNIIDVFMLKHRLNQRLPWHLPQQQVIVLQYQDQLAGDFLHSKSDISCKSVPLLQFSHCDQLILLIECLQVHLELLVFGYTLWGESACLASVLVALFVAITENYYRNIGKP